MKKLPILLLLAVTLAACSPAGTGAGLGRGGCMRPVFDQGPGADLGPATGSGSVAGSGLADDEAPAAAVPALDGFPIANFAVTANVSADGGLFGRILHNRGKLGDWLTDLGALRLTLAKDGTEYPLSGFAQRDVRRAFPFVTAALSGHEAIRSEVRYEAWAPLGLDDLDVTTLPVLQLELTLTNPSDRPESLTLCWTPDSLGQSPSRWRDFRALTDAASLRVQNGPEMCTPQCSGTAENAKTAGNASVAVPAGGEGEGKGTAVAHNGAEVPGNGPLKEATVVVPAGGSVTLRCAVVLYDPRGYVAIRFPSQDAVADYVFDRWDVLKQATWDFDARIPRTGDAELDDDLRWYMVPGVALTKCTAKEQVVTLGYCELNQRDSYWASWLHLDLFPSAERTMILESIGGMRPSGKIPTCILPRIDRKDDIDINAFFLLRCYRYVRYTGDLELIRTHWDALCKAADWLISRDLEEIGLPMQTSTWADWKDVAGVAGRKYSPFATLVYAAAMRRMAAMAQMLLDEPVVTADQPGALASDEKLEDVIQRAEEIESMASLYSGAADRAVERINRPRRQGGLWNGRYYCQLWEDGRSDDRLLQDQTVGILLGVVPKSRARSVIRALNRTNRTPYGICETYPYYPADFGYEPATYHNGAVWPWLSFADDWARLTLGRRREAIRLVKTVARADLVDSGDWAANEHINSLTGENLGFQLQGWNAALYGLVRFGLGETDFAF